MPQALEVPMRIFILNATPLTSTNTTAFKLDMTSSSIDFMLNVTAASGTSPTLDVVLQTSYDWGTTYVDLPMRFAQITSSPAVRHLVVRNGLGPNESALEQVAAPTGGSLAKNVNFDPRYMKVKYSLSGTSPSFTTTLVATYFRSGAVSAI